MGPSGECPPQPATIHPWRLILLGAPGVGKGTQAELLHQSLGACHLSTGDLFRGAKNHDGCEHSPAMALALESMRKGELVPDSTVWEIVRERSRCLGCRGGLILDGFPRTVPQAMALRELMEREKLTLDGVVNYELPIPEIVERLSGRWTCEQCKAIYHATQRPPRVEGICDQCGGRLFQREDDRPEAIAVRMEAYQRSTAPLIEFYRNLGLLLSVAAVGSPAEICARTVSELKGRIVAKAPHAASQYFPI
jgi:adenylate kinase